MADLQATEMKRESVNEVTHTNRPNSKTDYKNSKGQQTSGSNYPSRSRQKNAELVGANIPIEMDSVQQMVNLQYMPQTKPLCQSLSWKTK